MATVAVKKEISVKEAADLVGINRRSIVFAIQSGKIEARKEAGFLYLCSKASVLQYKKDREKALAAQNGNGHAKPVTKTVIRTPKKVAALKLSAAARAKAASARRIAKKRQMAKHIQKPRRR